MLAKISFLGFYTKRTTVEKKKNKTKRRRDSLDISGGRKARLTLMI